MCGREGKDAECLDPMENPPLPQAHPPSVAEREGGRARTGGGGEAGWAGSRPAQ